MIIFTYDGLNRMLVAEKKVNNVRIAKSEFNYLPTGKVDYADEYLFDLAAKRIDYDYDQAGFLTRTTYPDTTQVNITPDQLGRISNVKIGTSTNLADYVYVGHRTARLTYDVSLRSDIVVDHGYDNMGRITGINTSPEIVNFAYGYQAQTMNISSQAYNHRAGDPQNTFGYDMLNRLSAVEYANLNDDETFTLDDLGNRTQTTRGAATHTYSVKTATNGYNSVDSNALTYDNAGNMTTAENGYAYEYDYENRVVKIKKNNITKAEFDYDALGRRIRKIDSVASQTTVYYNNSNWQVLCEYDGAGNYKRMYVYGNYIDEVLYKSGDSSSLYYVNDHLYSPTALVSRDNGSVLERYEYDAYGMPHIYDGSFNTRTQSSYANCRMFTGRETDTFDSGNLKVQYNRERYLTYSLGGWFTRDPLGVVPNAQSPNEFSIVKSQYKDGMSLYQYVASNPINYSDLYGLYWVDFEIFPPSPAPPTLNPVGNFQCCPNALKAIGMANSALKKGKCRAWFEKNNAFGEEYEVRLRSWKVQCWIGIPAYTWAISKDIAICRQPACSMEPIELASLLIHEVAHHYVGAGFGREERASDVQETCSDELMGASK